MRTYFIVSQLLFLLSSSVVGNALAQTAERDRYQELERSLSVLDPAARAPALDLAHHLVVLIAAERAFNPTYRLAAAGEAGQFVDRLQSLAPDVAANLLEELRNKEEQKLVDAKQSASGLNASHSSIGPPLAPWAVWLSLCIAALVLGAVTYRLARPLYPSRD